MTSKEALEKLKILAVDEESDCTNWEIVREYTDKIKEDLEFLEILKKYFYLKFNTYEWGNFITVVGKEDYDKNGGIDTMAISDFIEDKDIEFLKKYFEDTDKNN